MRTLLSAYDASPAVARFLAADHEVAGVRRYLAWLDGEPVGAAAMSQHPGGWVLGGAATLERFRGNGVQSALLRARLADIERELRISGGTEVSVAVTAAPDSPSLRNLARAGFTVFPRRSWVTPSSLA